MDNPGDVNKLLTPEKYDEFVAKEKERKEKKEKSENLKEHEKKERKA